jgi:Ca2+-transporting ATPase
MYIKPLANFFELEGLTLAQLGISVLIGFVFVIWFEIVKWRNRITLLKNK